MVTLMSHQQSRRERDERRQGDTGASVSETSLSFPEGAAMGIAGLATASTAITCLAAAAISQPSSDQWPASHHQQVDDNGSSVCYYLLALSAGLFYTGIAELGAAVWVMAEPRGRVAAGRRLVYASLVPLTAAVVLSVATLFW